MGFEPTVPLRVHTPSKRAPSATRSSLPAPWALALGSRPRDGARSSRAWRHRRRPRPTKGRNAAAPACSRNRRTPKTKLAERVGFEPTEPQAAQRFSRPPDSTALASLRAPGWREVVACMDAHSGDQYPWMGEGRLRSCRRPTSIDSTRSSPAHAGDDLAIRAQEDSNLRPLDPQSNALSRLSYGHIPVSPFVHPCTRARLAIQLRGMPRKVSGEGGIRTPGTLSGYNALAGRPIRPLSHLSLTSIPPTKHPQFKREASAFSSQARKGGARDT